MMCTVRRSAILGAHLLVAAAVAGAAQSIQPPDGHRSVAGRSAASVAGSRPEAVSLPDQPTESRQRVTLSLADVTLGDALHEIAMQSRTNVAYSSHVVPIHRRISLRVRNATTEDALRSVLAGTGIGVRVWSATQIVLERPVPQRDVRQVGQVRGRVLDATTNAPIERARVTADSSEPSTLSGADGSYRLTGLAAGSHRITARRIGFAPASRAVIVVADSDVTLDLSLREAARTLDQVVVTGTVAPTEVRAVPTPITVVSAQEIQQLGITDIDGLFRGTVPGAVAVDAGTHDGYPGLSFRGGTDFNQGYSGATAKIYVDGVELAYSNTISQIDPNTIDHIEITRGPQASTLYGAGAMVGVIQVFTKRGTAGLTHPRFDAQVSAGGLQSQWSGTTLHQDHSLGITGGSATLDYAARVSYTSTGEWAPEYQSQRSVYSGRLGTILGGVRLDLTGQYSHRLYDVPPVNPYMVEQIRAGRWHTSFDAFYANPFHPDYTRTDQSVGLTAAFRTAPWWEHHVVLGYDGYDNPRSQTQPRFTRPADSLRAYGEYQTSRASVAYNTTVSVHLGSRVTSSLTVGAEHWETQEASVSASQRGDGTFAPGATYTRNSYANTGVFAQEQVGIANRLFFTAGVRGDRNDNFGSSYGMAVAPRFGVSYASAVGSVSYKLRTSYGVAIQPPLPYQKAASLVGAPFSMQIASPTLGPERQRGGDAGVDLYFGDRVSFGATYYNQRVDDLIASVTVSDPQDTIAVYENRNVGRIKNTGVELQSTAKLAALSITATYSVFNSTVEQIDPGSLGDATGQYHLGDRLLAIPRSAGGITTGLTLGRTQLRAGLTYIGSFRSYDRIAYYDAVYGHTSTPQPARAYIIDYPAVLKWSAGISQELPRGMSAYVRVDNLTNSYASEIDNVTAVYGRLSVLGVRATW